jgi:hypothetical protein
MGNASGAISLGEINRFFNRGGIPPKRDESGEVYRFWSRIRRDFESDYPGETVDYAACQEVVYANEYHSAYFKLFRKISPEYRKMQTALYDSILRNTDEPILIESSKYPLRALNLSEVLKGRPLDIKYVYLKKDPVKVIRSFQKKGLEQPPKGFLTANLYYLGVNGLCLWVLRKLKRKGHQVTRITFEDLIATPGSCLEAAGNALDMNLEEVIGKVQRATPLKTGYLFDGNRIRLKPGIVLEQSSKKADQNDFKSWFTRAFNYIIYK